MQKIIYILILLITIVTGCSPEWRTGKADAGKRKNVPEDNMLGSVVRNNLTNNDFYIQRADVDFVQENISVRLAANIKFKRPDSLLITIRSRTGIEAGRALITRDTMILIDRINRKLLIGKPSAIGSKYGIDPMMLYLVLGDIVIEDEDRSLLMECVKGNFHKGLMVRGKDVEYVVDCQESKLKQASLPGNFNTGGVRIDFRNITNSGSIVYPGLIEIVDELRSFSVKVMIRKIVSPWTGRTGVVTGKEYKVIRIR